MKRGPNRLAASLMAAVASTPAAAQVQVWVREVPARFIQLAADGTGGLFAAGTTGWYPGLGVWLSRYDAAGVRLWDCQLETPGADRAEATCADGVGGVYVSGSTTGNLAAPNQGGQDAWFARYDGDGNQLWIRQIGTYEAQEGANGLALDGVGGLFVGGEGALGGPSLGTLDGWIARYDGTGNQTWMRQDGTSAIDWRTDLAPDGAGGSLMVGRIAPLGGTSDVWITRYSAAGDRLWAVQFGSSGSDNAWAVAADGAGGAFLGGWTRGDLAGPFAGGDIDAWLARYDSVGNRSWARQFGTSGDDTIDDAAPDGEGGVLVAGTNEATSTSAENYVARIDALGFTTWMAPIPNDLSGHAVAARDGGGFYVAGDTWLARYGDACYADCNTDSQLTVADFGCFQTKFVAADPYADCNGDGQRTVADFGCFQTRFVAGCP